MNRFASLLFFFSLTASGCTPSDQPELGQVVGKITLDGQPLVGVAVVFQPDNGRPANGKTDAEGNYELTYIRQTRGAKVGNNRVEIAPSEGEEVDEVQAEDVDSVSTSKAPAKAAKAGKPKVPARYNSKSELQREVKPGKNIFDFELTSKT